MTVYQNMNNENEDTKRYWLYSPGEQAVEWEEFYKEGIMAIRWDELGDLKNYADRKSILKALMDNYGGGEKQPNWVSALDDFYNGENKINIGDIVIVKRGTKTLLGYGKIISDYYFDEERAAYKHCREVKWLKKGVWDAKDNLPRKTLTDTTLEKAQYLLNIMNENINKQENKDMIELLKYKPQIILQGPPGTGKTREAKRIAKALLGLGENDSLEGNEQFKLIQFHPSYSYEDFVRGIVAKPNEEGNGIVYTAENKVLGKFTDEAQKSLEKCLERQSKPIKWQDFRDFLLEKKKKNKEVYFSDKVKLDRIENYKDGRSALYFLVRKNEDWIPNEKMIHFSNFSQENLDDNFKKFYTSYDRGYWESITNYFINWFKEPEPYVLVIDEINRANLSAVLGELIYALEYRGEAVQSMYAIDGENNLILPPNLYIIGTMNTADRSVGHIDYAIRRRFAFVNILPKDLTNELGDQFKSALFAKVTNLFNTNLSSEFKKEEVQLGHSYFITKNTPIDIRWEYEIKPILLEYVKDGILVGEGIETTINNLINNENTASRT
ncbi:McrB family protein [Capnocytophaga leadbetteri]|uniref:McrB family protein n=1 Tax=Capnocytophaga leadbetteri TaxID=327575 RepID=UPI003C73E581